ncbi:putative ACT domain-containing protein ACR1-12 [Helianthus debilis subsp. tardiflorus]
MCLKAADERRAPEGVRLELFKPDKPGLLAQVTRTFRENAMNVTQAEISTTMALLMKVLIQMVLWVALQVKDKKLLRGTSTTWPYISGRRFCELLN